MLPSSVWVFSKPRASKCKLYTVVRALLTLWKEKRSTRKRKKKGRRKKWWRKEKKEKEGQEEKEDVKEGGVGTVTADVPFYCWDKTQTNSNSGKTGFLSTYRSQNISEKSQGMYVTHMNAERLEQHTQDLHRFKVDKFPEWRRGGGHKAPPLIKKLAARDAGWERQKGSSSDVPLGTSTTLREGPYPGAFSQTFRWILWTWGLCICMCFLLW